jgi:predicted membrane-bound spermidine synthase
MKAAPRLLVPLVMACLFVSGLAGLLYEIVWARYLALFLGHSSYAVVAVLVAFMGGLALGNAWIGSLADRSRKPLVFYGWIEVGIGLYALVFPAYYGACRAAFVGLAQRLEPGSTVLEVLKLAFSLATILAPTVLMGGTLPLLARLLARSLAEVRPSVATLYAINSAGAVVGCWLADFRLIPALGLRPTLCVGAALNLAAGAAALLGGRFLRDRPEAGERAAPEAGVTAESYSRGDLSLALVAIAASGFVAMLYEVAWTRLLALALGSTTHAFSLMLMTFIAGIAAGAWLVSRGTMPRGAFRAFGWAEVALALAVCLSMFLYAYLPFWFARLASFIVRTDQAYPLVELAQGGLCFAVMFIPTVCLGMTLPLASRVATAEVQRTGRSVGRVFAVNTLGTVLGAALTGVWVLPALGLARTFALGVALNAAIGLAILLRGQARVRPPFRALALAGGAVGLALAGQSLDSTWQRAFALGLFRYPKPPQSRADYWDLVRNTDVAYHRDGAGSTVAVLRCRKQRREDLSLMVNGKPEASSAGDMPTQLLSGHLPLLLQPTARQVLVVGLGSGVTCGAVLRHPTVERLEVVEISPEVVAAARRFGPYNDQALDNPRLHLVVEDAKTYLQTARRTYDLIISEPSNPWMAGVASVFSREFYEDCRARLRPEGLMVQWVQLYETSDAAFDIMLRTFGAVFPSFGAWEGAAGDMLLIGSNQPLQVDLGAFCRRFEQAAIKADLARAGIARLPVLLAHEVISPQNGPFVAAGEPRTHSDLHPVLEYVAQRNFFTGYITERWRQLDENLSPRGNSLLARYLKAHPLEREDFLDLKRYCLPTNAIPLAWSRSLLCRWQQERPEDPEQLQMAARLAETATPKAASALAFEPWGQRLRRDPAANLEPLRRYALALMNHYRERRSLLFVPPAPELQDVLQQLIAADPDHRPLCQIYLAELAWDRGDDDTCLELVKLALAGAPDSLAAKFQLDPEAPLQIVASMAQSLAGRGQLLDAVALCDQAVGAGLLNAKTRAGALRFDATQRRLLAALAGDPVAAWPAK